MRAFVLSGAGNRGPLEAGALMALLEAGIEPDFFVGTSAGAINSLYLAAHGATVDAANEMPGLWRSFRTKDVYPNNIFHVLWRLITKKNSLYTNDGVRRLISGILPDGVRTFADLKVPLYTTAVDIRTSRLFSFGAMNKSETPLVDIVMASAAVPAIHPPITYHGLQLVDGSVIANVAASFAMQHGATEIYLLNAGRGLEPEVAARGVFEIVRYTWGTMISQSLLRDVARAEADDSVDLHHIHLDSFRNVWFRDFSKSDAMIRDGYETAKAYLLDPAPKTVAPLDSPAQPGSTDLPPGAVEFSPPRGN